MKIVVVIPAFKAAATLPSVLRRIPPSTLGAVHKILVVEDGGPSVERSVKPALLSEFPQIEVLFHGRNRGYGGAQKTGYRRALELGCDIAVLLHADGQYAPEEMERLWRPLFEKRADIVLGSRMKSYRSALKGGMPLYKFIANILLSKLENRAYGLKLSEYHSGYMLYSRTALETIPFERPSPTHYGDEKSHLKPIEYGTQVLKTVFNFWRGKYDY
ncbi:MAG: glycosyltransferase family 2 protein [Bdellovibrionia bacterium]